VRLRLTRWRVVGIVLVALVAAAAWSVWSLYAAQRDLRGAQADASVFLAALEDGDEYAALDALAELQDSAGQAADRTGGPWWSVMTVTPGIGDDLGGIRAVSQSLDEVATGAGPEVAVLPDDVEALIRDRRIDVEGVAALGPRVARADDSARAAYDEVADLDSSGYVGLLRDRFDEYVGDVERLHHALRAARTAVDVAPTMLGADGPRDYLLVFQNNAEVRASGGLSGAWARLHVDDGRLELEEQGDAGDFEVQDASVLPLSAEEDALYGEVVGQYFADPVMVPDFPRAAELFDAFWQTEFPQVELDGVLTMDTVALAYVLKATDPVDLRGYTLTPANVVDSLLNQLYIAIDDPEMQDELFTEAASQIFIESTSGATSASTLAVEVGRAIGEGRLAIAAFDPAVAERLQGTAVAGELSGDEGSVPHVDVTLDDATGAKMSFYLRHSTSVRSVGCDDGRQQLEGVMRLHQTISRDEAARTLPDYVTGGGRYAVEVGTQQVLVRIYTPYGGELGEVYVDGERMPRFEVEQLDGRRTITLALAIEGPNEVEVTWDMTSGPGQADDGVVHVTPGVEVGDVGSTFSSAC
jgi:hypothetical protein